MEIANPGKPPKPPKVAKVKNKAPASIQITAEQLLREAKERELEIVPKPPRQKISDPEELAGYQLRKRKAFEDNIRKNRSVMSNWFKYAQWEESQREIQRARSVYERALDTDHRNIPLWLRYTEMEMRAKQINHARNLWDRAVTILPRANQFWYKYTYMEEMLGNIAGCRAVFERWMEWSPEEQAWMTFVNFELRYHEVDRARHIYERFVMAHPDVKNWIKYARFEEKHQNVATARKIYERAVDFFGEQNMFEQLFIAFARFEENQREHERVRVIYQYALQHMNRSVCEELYKHYTVHEKKYGDRQGIENVVVSKRKHKYETELEENPHNYDAWFDLLRLLEAEGEQTAVRDTYERAIANVPLTQEKRFWRRYIYLWINYAVYEELTSCDLDRTRQVYKALLSLLPHRRFTFAKAWLMYAHFEVRQKDLTAARRALGTAIGKCPKDKLFRGYIELEIQLREFDRCRILYEKFLEFGPQNCTTWVKFAELESLLGDVERARAIYQLAVAQPRLDMPEVLWKSFIDFETDLEEFEHVRQLYERLLQRTQHVKVWLSYAQFELRAGEQEAIGRASDIYRRANAALRQLQEKEQRLMLLEAWRAFEAEMGTDEGLASVAKLMPNKVKRRRKVVTDEGVETGWEEYYDYIFPEDEANKPNLRLLQMAKLWKQKQEMGHGSDPDHVDSDHEGGDSGQGHGDSDEGHDGSDGGHDDSDQGHGDSDGGHDQGREDSDRNDDNRVSEEENRDKLSADSATLPPADLDRDDPVSSTSSESESDDED